jgi:hypothetical protein
MTDIKNGIHKALTTRLLGVAVAAAALITPSIASAQDVPSYATGGAANGGADQQIQGTISSINGTWNITVADANGYSDSVQLEQGTIINPTGLTLEAGMNVTIDGYADGSNFDAVEIDTPYQYSGPAPVAVYYGPGAWYPGYAYGWGPSFSLFFNFGNRGFIQRPFAFGGQVRQAMAPPAGWENRPHGYVGHAATARSGYVQERRPNSAPQQHAFVAPPQQRYTAPQQSRTFTAPQQSRTFAAPQQRFSAPQQQRSFAAPQRVSAPQRSYSAPAARANAAPRVSQSSGDHRRG